MEEHPNYKWYILILTSLTGAFAIGAHYVERVLRPEGQQPVSLQVNAQGQLITINRVEVQVFEFAHEGAREAAAAGISPDGSSIGTTMVTWIDRPNFWAKGRVVVLYVGQDAATIQQLTAVLGEPIVQGQSAPVQPSLTNTKWELFSFGFSPLPEGQAGGTLQGDRTESR